MSPSCSAQLDSTDLSARKPILEIEAMCIAIPSSFEGTCNDISA